MQCAVPLMMIGVDELKSFANSIVAQVATIPALKRQARVTPYMHAADHQRMLHQTHTRAASKHQKAFITLHTALK